MCPPPGPRPNSFPTRWPNRDCPSRIWPIHCEKPGRNCKRVTRKYFAFGRNCAGECLEDRREGGSGGTESEYRRIGYKIQTQKYLRPTRLSRTRICSSITPTGEVCEPPRIIH